MQFSKSSFLPENNQTHMDKVLLKAQTTCLGFLPPTALCRRCIKLLVPFDETRRGAMDGALPRFSLVLFFLFFLAAFESKDSLSHRWHV